MDNTLSSLRHYIYPPNLLTLVGWGKILMCHGGFVIIITSSDMKVFNTTGKGIPSMHYMVDICGTKNKSHRFTQILDDDSFRLLALSFG